MTTRPITFDQYRADMLAARCEEVLERLRPPGTVLPVHANPFEANALVVHVERYGPEGATSGVARRAG